MDKASGNEGRKTGGRKTGERKTGERQRQAQERRRRPDRRNGLDRRGIGEVQPIAEDSRPYAFRTFNDRRNPQDRRLFVVGSRPCQQTCQQTDDRSGEQSNERCSRPQRGLHLEEEDGFYQLSRQELRRLLSDFDD